MSADNKQEIYAIIMWYVSFDMLNDKGLGAETSVECSINKVLSRALSGVGFEERLDDVRELAK